MKTHLPHSEKIKVVRHYQKKSGYKVFVETGTYAGEMLDAQKECFDKLISIELDEKYYRKAVEKFRKYKHIEVIWGNSATKLSRIAGELKRPVVFWLDAHLNTSPLDSRCPIMGEVRAILNGLKTDCVILIDDVRLFTGIDGAPDLGYIVFLLENDGYNVEIKDDIIRAAKP